MHSDIINFLLFPIIQLFFAESETNEMENQNAQELEFQEKAISTSKGEKLN